ncbi:3'-5' exonuclease [Aestuariibacter halophilus]|uniref:3'-5' exonuclease n=1 Tax=Fluctibacter halophilus TaxID=226011 RepID=A0ABS8G702_9ALTE|nr:3'-5' exonuclease [Aestuariibacter halophilus]MCC2616377.1 3'-5' exonuclease [Aestuariibacter halophilus]
MGILSRWFGVKTPLPEHWQGVPVWSLPLLAVDLELTSLDLTTSRILSVGWVAAEHRRIQLSSCYYQVTRTKANLNQSPVVHGLTEETIVQGQGVKDSLQRLAELARTHVLVFHNHQLDWGVIQRAASKLKVVFPDVVCVDTLLLAKYQLDKQQRPPAPNALTLAGCRQRLGLPPAPAHNALDDALATLELCLAQWHEMGLNAKDPLEHVRHTGAIAVFMSEQ